MPSRPRIVHLVFAEHREEGVRVLHFGRFYDSNFGGLERHVDTLLTGLASRITVDNLVSHERYVSDTIARNGYTIYRVPTIGRLAGTALSPTMPHWARRLHKKHHYDIVHLHFPDPTAHLASRFLPRNVKLVITWHSDIVRQKRLLMLYRPFLARILDRADALIVPTPQHIFSSTELKRMRHPDRARVVPFGMDYSRFDDAAKRTDRIAAMRAKVPAGSCLLFALGRHVYYKGFEYLIRAMAGVPHAVLWIGGTGPLTKDLKALARSLCLTDKVIFLERIADEDLPLYYHACDVFCMPSIEPAEAFGLVQIEAMACGKPVICCELGNGVNYVNRDGWTGIAVPPRDVNALAQAINSLVGSEKRRKELGLAGFNRVRHEFSIARMVDGTLDVYRSLMDARRL